MDNESNSCPIKFSESAIAKILSLLGKEENSADLYFRVSYADEEWRYYFEEDFDIGFGDNIYECGGFRVLLNNSALRVAGDSAVLSYDSDADSFNVSNSRTDDKDEAKGLCKHLSQLPTIPSVDALHELRKSLRRKKIPDMPVGWKGGHSGIGEFSIINKEGVHIEWELLDKPAKCFSLEDLCLNSDRELDRLEFGWLIANMAQLDKLHQLEAVNMGNPLYEIQERARICSFFEKLEKSWRHWALVPAGHMILPPLTKS